MISNNNLLNTSTGVVAAAAILTTGLFVGCDTPKNPEPSYRDQLSSQTLPPIPVNFRNNANEITSIDHSLQPFLEQIVTTEKALSLLLSHTTSYDWSGSEKVASEILSDFTKTEAMIIDARKEITDPALEIKYNQLFTTLHAAKETFKHDSVSLSDRYGDVSYAGNVKIFYELQAQLMLMRIDLLNN
jgi:hypothetical protein